MTDLVFQSRRDWLEQEHGMEFGNPGGEEIVVRVDSLWYSGASMNLVLESIQKDLANRYMSGDFRNPISAPVEGHVRIKIGYRLWDFDRYFDEFDKEHPAKIIERIRQLLLPLATREPYKDTTVWGRMGDVSVPSMVIEKEET
ncbi:hypothetical protein N8T08_008416 [Aspergillus melleus]|uniref:Uncharacterized protein n=1 Tax=Aspergillus melleus TaxID=138277 RepID=A0ACC3AW54_9EURO|nr:hypothetical protein N8T08_008416 [Aspergillus melleus]